MPVPGHVIRFWHALDACFGRVQPTWWGAVVTDDRYPAIWDANYARVDSGGEDLGAADIEDELLPALAAVGSDVMHVVSFDADASGPLLAELSTRGHRLTFDLVMDRAEPPATSTADVTVEELPARRRALGAGRGLDGALRRGGSGRGRTAPRPRA